MTPRTRNTSQNIQKTNLTDLQFVRALSEDLFLQREDFKNNENRKIYLNNWLEREHVSGAIQGIVAEDKALKGVKVFPTYCAWATRYICANEIHKKLTENMPREEPLPEPSTLKTKKEKAAYRKELNKRNARDLRLNKKSLAILESSGIDDTKLFDFFLKGSRRKGQLWQNQPLSTITAGDFWVIPVRLNENHYTTFIVRFNKDKTFTMMYFDSNQNKDDYKEHIPPSIEPIIHGLRAHCAPYFEARDFKNYSLPLQKSSDSDNCGVFTYYMSLHLIYKKFNKPSPQGQFDRSMSDALLQEHYSEFMTQLRQDMVSCLKKQNYKVEFVNQTNQEANSSFISEDNIWLTWKSLGLMGLGLVAMSWLALVGMPLPLMNAVNILTTPLIPYLPTNPFALIFMGAFGFAGLKSTWDYYFQDSEEETPLDDIEPMSDEDEIEISVNNKKDMPAPEPKQKSPPVTPGFQKMRKSKDKNGTAAETDTPNEAPSKRRSPRLAKNTTTGA